MTTPKVPRSWVEALGPLRCQGLRGLGLGLWGLIFRVGFRVLDLLQISRAIMMRHTFCPEVHQYYRLCAVSDPAVNGGNVDSVYLLGTG